jgi:PAS domain S-box-containing protein
VVDYRKLDKAQLIKHLKSIQAAVAPGQGCDEKERLLHELQVHQIELEVQNRALREAQQALEASRDRYVDLYDFAPVGYATLDDKGIIRELNLTAARMLGRERSGLLGIPFALRVANGATGNFFTHIKRVFASGQRQVTELEMQDGGAGPRHVRLESVLVGHVPGRPKACHTAMIDITERTEAAKALQQAYGALERRVEERTAALRHSLRDHEIVAAILRLSLGRMSLQEVLEETLSLVLTSHGLGLESQGVIFLVEDDTRELVLRARQGLPDGIVDSCARVPFGRCLCGRAAESGSILHVDEFDHRHETTYPGMMLHGHYCAPIKSDGEMLGVLNLYVPEGHQSSAVEERLVTAVADTLAGVIHRKRIEESLAETQARYQDLYDHAPDMFASVDARTADIIQCNQTLADTLGYRKEEIIGRKVFDVYPPDCLAEAHKAFDAFVETGEGRDAELQIRTRDGSKIAVSLNVTAVRDEKGRVLHLRSAWRDITEHKLAEQQARDHQAQLAHVARLSTLGEMATGIAHELNQPLTAMVTSTQACLRLMASGKAEPDKLRDVLHEVAAQGLRAGEIIRRLREFTRLRETKRASVDLNQLVREVVRFVEAEAREEDICMRLELDHALPQVVVDAIQVEQVILNLLRNAMDAMEGTAVGERVLSVRTTETKAGRVELSVCDTGPGVSKEDAARIFDPFFTTKPHGMGMGLSISHSIVEAHKGRLWAEAARGKGAMFRLTLPPAVEAVRVER